MAGHRALIYNNLSVTLAAGLPILRSIPISISGMKGTIPTAFEILAKGLSVLVQRELDKSTSLLRDCLAFGKEVFLGITKL